MKIKIILLLLLVLRLNAQPLRTVGLLSYDKENAFPGLNLFAPRGTGNVYLINNCGEVVHQWLDDTNIGPNQSVYLQEDGSIFMAKGKEPGTTIEFGTFTEKIEHRSWDNELLWSFTYSDSLLRAHHDFKVLPNGNILLIAWELKSEYQALLEGRKQELIPLHRIISEQIVEIKPLGKTGGEVVWIWHAWDHLVQDFAPTLNHYSPISKNPERINVNYKTYSTKDDWLHFNSLDYHEAEDLILISVSAFNEIWVIDHSTNSEEAAGSKGGRYGKGGDLLWRWGNPGAYQTGDSSLQRLFFQHNAHWLNPKTKNLDILLFNNNAPDSASSVSLLRPILKAGKFQKRDKIFLPQDFLWTYTTPEKGKMFSPVGSGVQALPNGNFLICAGKQGYAFEIDTMQRVVWEYKVPLQMGKIISQGTKIPLSDNRIFRMERYALDFKGFQNKKISHGLPLEMLSDTAFCHSLHYFDVEKRRLGIYFYWNQHAGKIFLSPITPFLPSDRLVLKNENAEPILSLPLLKNAQINTQTWEKGKYAIYFGESFLFSVELH